MLEKYAVTKLITALENLEVGTFNLRLPSGVEHQFRGRAPGPTADLHILDSRVFSRVVRHGNIALTETYRDGLWRTSNLTELLSSGMQNMGALNPFVNGSALLQVLNRIKYTFQANTLRGSRRNIHAHYDLGNDFYQLWLDSSMTYSSALYRADHLTLSEAQAAKYDRILQRLDAESGSLLEIGCGWGGFAERALAHGDFGVKGVTLSEQQALYARDRLGNTVDIALEDYRVQTGKYDHIVSIEMFEAVGEQYWKTYFAKLKSLLAKNGSAVVQTITVNDRAFETYRRGGDMIRSFIFPGGMLPSPTRFRQEAERAGLVIADQYCFGRDYARTLEAWKHSFEAKLDQVRALGFDEKFIRIWRFYLSACIATFNSGSTDVMQVELRHE